MADEPTRLLAPDTASVAAEQLHDLGRALDERRSSAKRYRNCRDRMEHLYRKAKSRALIDPSLDGRNKEERDARAHEWKLDGDTRAEAAQVAEAMGLDGTVPETVGELRWLRDRAEGLAEAASAAAYDQREQLRGWTVVASWAKAERHDVMEGPAAAQDPRAA